MEIILFAIIGGILSRWHGSASWGCKSLKNIIWATPIALCMVFELLPYTNYFVTAIATATAFISCLAGKATGHGQYMSFANSVKYMKEKRVDFILKWFFGKDPRTDETLKGKVFLVIKAIALYGKRKLWWRCFSGLSIVGFAAVSGAVLVMSFINPQAALIIASGGCLKAVAYALGWAVFKGDKATITGEFLTGFFAYGGLALAISIAF